MPAPRAMRSPNRSRGIGLAADWQYLENMHIAFFPSVRFTAFDHPHDREPGAAPPKGPTPAEQALEYIVKSSPLHTTEWAEWQASMQAPKLAGRWLISGNEPGKGRFFGEMTIEPSATGDSFTTTTKVACGDGDSLIASSGKALVYTGYNWRGRSTAEKAGTGPEAPKTVREVMALSKDQNEFTGRWFGVSIGVRDGCGHASRDLGPDADRGR